MHHKGHDTGSQDIVLHVGVPGSPQALSDVELNIVLGDLIKLAPVGVRLTGEDRGSRIPVEDGIDQFLFAFPKSRGLIQGQDATHMARSSSRVGQRSSANLGAPEAYQRRQNQGGCEPEKREEIGLTFRARCDLLRDPLEPLRGKGEEWVARWSEGGCKGKKK